MKIAIPTYKRSKMIDKLTLSMLKDFNVANELIYLFVSNEKEYEDYSYLIKDGYNLIYKHDLYNLKDKHNFILDYFSLGERIIVIEDDLKSLKIKNGNKIAPFKDFDKMVIDAWKECDRVGSKLWGVYPMCNGMFMKEGYTNHLICIAGYLFGIEITKDKFLRCNTENKHDYERSILHYIKYGALCRIDYVAQYSSSFTNKGGLQAQHTNEERCLNEIKGNDYLIKRFPHLIRKSNRQNKVFSEPTELRMKSVDKESNTDLFALQRIIDKQIGFKYE